MIIAKIKVYAGNYSHTEVTLYSRGRNWGLIATTDRDEAGKFTSIMDARDWIEQVFHNADEWTYEEIGGNE